MGLYSHIQEAWKSEKLNPIWRERLITWRKEPVTLRIQYPTRLDRAKALGYRAKQGVFMIRQRVLKGAHRRPDWSGGRMSSNMRATKELRKTFKLIAEERAAKKYSNCEVLNSYFVARDGKYEWYEVILADRSSTQVLSDKRLSWISEPSNRGRVFRGLTSAGRRMRGLRWKGKGSEKTRPSRRAHERLL